MLLQARHDLDEMVGLARRAGLRADSDGERRGGAADDRQLPGCLEGAEHAEASVPEPKFAHTSARPHLRNFGFERTLETYDFYVVLVQKFPHTLPRGASGNFWSTTLND